VGVQVEAHAAVRAGAHLGLAAQRFWRRPRCGRVLDGLRARLLAVDRAVSLYGNATAAVAILLRQREELAVLVQERATRESDPWSGQWSFPGGRRKEGESLLETARRETEEEVGFSLRAAEVLGCIEARAPGNLQILVLPFVFAWTGDEEPTLGPEVASTVWIPLARLPQIRTSTTIRLRGRELQMPAFVDGRRTIWGFTYRLLEDLLALLQ